MLFFHRINTDWLRRPLPLAHRGDASATEDVHQACQMIPGGPIDNPEARRMAEGLKSAEYGIGDQHVAKRDNIAILGSIDVIVEWCDR